MLTPHTDGSDGLSEDFDAALQHAVIHRKFAKLFSLDATMELALTATRPSRPV